MPLVTCMPLCVPRIPSVAVKQRSCDDGIPNAMIVEAEIIDAYGDTVSRAEKEISRPAEPEQVATALRTAASKARQDAGLTPRLAVVSAAHPVDRTTGRLTQLPDAPFKKAIEADYLVHHDTPTAARSKRTHLVHATCHRSRQPPRRAGNTVMQQTT
jgi:hypothetical protein